MSDKVKVFYSWQSDVTEVKDLITKHLRLAESAILKDDKLPKIFVDESTANRAGSPNIPETILEKIRESDIFIADVTIINADDEKYRKTPNPNVVFELGYAVSQLGWDRIILLNCNDNGKAEDLPFDFRSHRATSFSLKSNNLQTDIKKAIVEIIEKNPTKPSSHLSIKDVQRNKDLKNIRWTMETLHIPTVEELTKTLPFNIYKNIFNHWESFNSCITDSSFFLYDKEMDKIFKNFHNSFKKCMDKDCYYEQNNKYKDIFILSSRQGNEIAEMTRSAEELKQSLVKLIRYLHENYPELDIQEMSQKALEKQKEFEKQMEFFIEDESQETL